MQAVKCIFLLAVVTAILVSGAGSQTPTATPVPCSAPLWESTSIYWGGDEVTHANHHWRAQWWTQGDEPGTTGPDGVWLDLGPCTGQPSPTPTPPVYPPPGWPDRIFAPYVDLLLYPTTSINQVYANTGQKYFTLAFITSGGGCTPAWGGVIPVSDDIYRDEINTIRGEGGDVIVSFGGASGLELAMTCESIESLTAAYQSVIDRYDLTWIDFDIEGAAVADPPSIDRRNKAIRNLQLANPTLKIAFCLPVLPAGLTLEGLNVLQNALSNEVRIDTVNIMAMDYGSAAAPDPDGMMGEYAIQAAQNLFIQLESLFPDRPDTEIWGMIGITPMIGRNDVEAEIFYQQDAEELLAFATAQNIDLLSMWSIARDIECAGGGHQIAPNCSGIDQTPYEFTTIFLEFSSPLPTPTPTPSPVQVPSMTHSGLLVLLVIVSMSILINRRFTFR